MWWHLWRVVVPPPYSLENGQMDGQKPTVTSSSFLQTRQELVRLQFWMRLMVTRRNSLGFALIRQKHPRRIAQSWRKPQNLNVFGVSGHHPTGMDADTGRVREIVLKHLHVQAIIFLKQTHKERDLRCEPTSHWISEIGSSWLTTSCRK